MDPNLPKDHLLRRVYDAVREAYEKEVDATNVTATIAQAILDAKNVTTSAAQQTGTTAATAAAAATQTQDNQGGAATAAATGTTTGGGETTKQDEKKKKKKLGRKDWAAIRQKWTQRWAAGQSRLAARPWNAAVRLVRGVRGRPGSAVVVPAAGGVVLAPSATSAALVSSAPPRLD